MEESKTDTLKKLYIKLKKTQERLSQLEALQKSPIAIIGMGCRLPGGANSPEQYWEFLENGVDTISEVSPDRWDGPAYYDPDPGAPGKMYTAMGGFLDAPVKSFDPGFFNISPKEAMSMDPQHRLLLEVTWEALEYAGLDASTLRGSKTGVFVGISCDDYTLAHRHSGDLSRINAYTMTGSTFSTAAGRISYLFDFQGPCFVVDTACSSSIVALHLACQSLRSGESDAALAGGVNLILTPEIHICFSKLQAISPDGRCKTFDASANGYARGEGCGIVVLKRLQDAVNDGDHILAVVRGTAINQDGKSNGLTAPNGLAQEKVIRQALENGGIPPADVSYVEAHGTGTPLGDPIEVESLGHVLGAGRTSDNPLIIGSAKTNIGHLEPAAGVAGLMKVILALVHEQIPPSLHFKTPNPHIPWDDLPIKVADRIMPWPRSDKNPRIAGLSSFGFSGTNSHAIIEEAPVEESRQQAVGSKQYSGDSGQYSGDSGQYSGDRRQEAEDRRQPSIINHQSDRPAHILCLSAKTEEALKALAGRYGKFLSPENPEYIGDICYTAHVGRTHFESRLALTGVSKAEMRDGLTDYLQGEISVVLPDKEPKNINKRLVFLFTGQGSQYAGMGQQLYETQPTFRRTLDQCDEILRSLLDTPILEVIYPPSTPTLQHPNAPTPLIDQTAYTQPAIFVLEYALAELWRSWGIKPSVVLGHSIGEYVAACVAGVFTLEDAIRLVAARGRLMQSLPAGGMMGAVFTHEENVKNIIESYGEQVSIAAVNAPTSVVISGEEETVKKILERLEAEGITSRRLRVSHAFHSPLMEPILEEFGTIASQIKFSRPKIPIVSNLSGQFGSEADIVKPEYWVRHIRESVRFYDSMKALEQKGYNVFLEVGAAPILTSLARQCVSEDTGLWLASMRKSEQDWSQILRSLGELYVHGIEVDWTAFDKPYLRHKIVLPGYPFQREKCWIEPINSPPEPEILAHGASVAAKLHPLIHRRLDRPLLKEALFETPFDVTALPFLADHLVYDKILVSGASYISMLLGASELVYGKGCALSDVLFAHALVVPEEDTCTVRVQITAEEHGKASFQVTSSGTNGSDGSDFVTVHATGTIVSEQETLLEDESFDAFQEVWDRCQEEITAAEFYQIQHDHHIDLGASYQWVGTIRRGKKEAVGRIKIPEVLEGNALEGYQMHPGLVDACFGLLVAAVDMKVEGTLVPFSIERFRYHDIPIDSQLWGHAMLRSLDESLDGRLVGDIRLFDMTGRLIAESIGLVGKKTNYETLLDSVENDRQDWLYEVEWSPEQRQKQEGDVILSPAPARGPWLILSDSQGTGDRIAELLKHRGEGCVLVFPGEGYEQVSNSTFQVDPANLADFRKLLNALGTDMPPVQKVIHLWSLDAVQPDTMTASDLGTASVKECCSTLHIVQALLQTGFSETPSLWLVTRGAQAIHRAEDRRQKAEGSIQYSVDRRQKAEGRRQEAEGRRQKISEAYSAAESLSQQIFPSASTLWGMGKVITLEHPEFNCVCVDLDPAGTSEEAQILFEEICKGSDEDQLAYRSNVRYLARLTRYNMNSSMRGNFLEFRGNASYLITGGLGALGLEVARWIVEKGGRHLILIGRKGATDEVRDQLEALEQAGAQIHIFKADVCEVEQVSQVLQKITQSLPELKGIIHAAGVLDDRVLMQQTWDSFERVMGPKVKGAWNLHTLTRNTHLDFFVMFSSAVSLLGSSGQANYGAANAFLDALAFYRRNLGLPAMSIDWGPWSETGIAVRHQAGEGLKKKGLGGITNKAGLRILEKLFLQTPVQIGVTPIDWPLFIKQWSDSKFFANFERSLVQPAREKKLSNFLDTLEEAPLNKRQELLKIHISSQVADVLGFKSSGLLNQRRGFTDMGMDSLASVELRNRLQNTLRCSLPATLAFDYPTLGTLVDYISREVLALQVSTASQILVEDLQDEQEDSLSARIDRFSEEELEQLLDEKVAHLKRFIEED